MQGEFLKPRRLKKKRKPIKRKFLISVKPFCDIPASREAGNLEAAACAMRLQTVFLLLLLGRSVAAQDQKVDATWLRRYIPLLRQQAGPPPSGSCQYLAIFGQGDAETRILQSVSRFGEIALDAHASCPSATYDREEEIDFVLDGAATLHHGDKTYAMRKNDFTYLTPGIEHSVRNNADQPLRLLVMGFKIPANLSIPATPPHPKIVNLDDVKEETVEGHPTSVRYKLLIGPRTGKRDAIDQAYVVTSFFWMNFAPAGTNFPHHHEAAEEIYLVLEGEGEMVAGSGMDGVEGRFPAKAGDAYYFRPNCTVGFYNQNKPGTNAYILAVRSRIQLPEESD